VGLGALATAYTVTFFYMLMLTSGGLRYHKPLGWFRWVAAGRGVLRLIVMAFPQNQWGQVIAPFTGACSETPC